MNKFEMDAHGNFRIMGGGKWSDWHGYQSIAHLIYKGKTYVGFSQYWEGGLPVEEVLEITHMREKTELLPENLKHKMKPRIKKA